MNKAYVIKNKEGKYFVNTYCWAKKICNAYIDDNKDSLEKLKETLLTDCEVVEITIAEGDLEQQLDKAEQELGFYQDEIKNRGTCGLCEKLENKQIKKLEQQLTEKNKEIKRLKYLLLDKENKATFWEQIYNQTIKDNKILKDCGSFTALNKIIRKQVIDEVIELNQLDYNPEDMIKKLQEGEQQ